MQLKSVVAGGGGLRPSQAVSVFLATLAASLCAVPPAVAQDAATEAKRLTKAEVESMVVGKKLQYVRASDGANVVWDLDRDGTAHYAPPKTMRNLTISGTYTVGDDGSLCFKWNQDKYVSMQDG